MSRLNALIAVVGPSPTLLLFAGRMPAAPFEAAPEAAIARVSLPPVWMAPPINGRAEKTEWPEGRVEKDGAAGWYMIRGASGAAIAGTAGDSESGAGLVVAPAALAAGQALRVERYALTEGGA